MPAPRLLVEIAASIGTFQQDMAKATSVAQDAGKKISAAFTLAKGALGALSGILGAHAIAGWAEDTVASAAALADFAQQTGSSVESLSKLSNQIKVAGGDFSTFQTLTLKLAAGMAGVDDESSKVGQALKFIGVSARDPVDAIQQVAQKLSQFEDGIGKAALARDLFGKGGPAFLAQLGDIARLSDIAATRTTEQAEAAKKLEEQMRRISIESDALKTALLSNVVPVLNQLIERFNLARTAGESWFQSLADAASGTHDIYDRIAQARKDLDQTVKDRASPSIFGGITDEDVRAAQAKLKTLIGIRDQAILAEQGDNSDQVSRRFSRKPQLNYTGAKTGTDDAAKKLLEQQLKEQENAIRAEQETLTERERFLQTYYQDDLIGLKDYYAGLQNSRDEALRKTLAAYDAEIAAAKNFIGKAATPADRIEGETKLADAIAKRARYEQDSNAKAYDSALSAARAYRQYAESVADLQADILQTAGSERAAAEIRFDIQNRQRKAQFTNAGDAGALANLAALKSQTLAQADLTSATRRYQLIQGDLSIEQSKIALAQESGLITSLDAINKRSALARQYVQILKDQADAEQKAAEALPTGPARDEALQKIRQERIAIDQLAASADELQNTFRGIGTSETTSFLDAIVTRSKTAKDAVRDLEKGILASIAHMADQNIAETIFGKNGIGGGISESLAKLFGGDKVGGAISTTAGATGANAALTALVPTTTAFAAALTAATTAATAFAASAGAGAAGSAAEGAGGLFSFLGTVPGFANGTNSAPGGLAWINERGPELVNLPRGAQVIPNHVLQSRRASPSQQRPINIYSTTNVLPGASTKTAKQAAADSARRISKAIAHNG